MKGNGNICVNSLWRGCKKLVLRRLFSVSGGLALGYQLCPRECFLVLSESSASSSFGGG